MKKTILVVLLALSAISAYAGCQGVFSINVQGETGLLRIKDDTAVNGVYNAQAEIILDTSTQLQTYRGRCLQRADGLAEITFNGLFLNQSTTYKIWGLNRDIIEGELLPTASFKASITGTKKNSNSFGYVPSNLCQGRFVFQADSQTGTLFIASSSVQLYWDAGGYSENLYAVCLAVSDTEAYLNFTRYIGPFYSQTYSAKVVKDPVTLVTELQGQFVVDHQKDARYSFMGRSY